jgi:ABC-type multidrug transport system fused ATPase/permease subunit
MRAIVGCYPLESGAVRIDGRPAEVAADAERAALLGYLPQDPVLFSGTVRDNVALAPADGRDGDRALAAALRLAALEDDLRAWPRGLDMDVGELGVRISGGQRQRIGLARAIAASGSRPPRLLVLDDPFSAVDVATEAAIVAALREAFGPTAPVDRRVTIVLSSHRLAAFPQADAVVVLQDGRVAEAGTHAELLAADGLYARIFRAQRVVESSVGTVA